MRLALQDATPAAASIPYRKQRMCRPAPALVAVEPYPQGWTPWVNKDLTFGLAAASLGWNMPATPAAYALCRRRVTFVQQGCRRPSEGMEGRSCRRWAPRSHQEQNWTLG